MNDDNHLGFPYLGVGDVHFEERGFQSERAEADDISTS